MCDFAFFCRMSDYPQFCHAILGSQALGALLAVCLIVRTLAVLRKRSSQRGKPAAPAAPAVAVTANSGPAKPGRQPGVTERERPSTDEIWEQLLQEQAQRLRATAEAGAARFGAASAKPNQGRPPDVLARLRSQRELPVPGNGDGRRDAADAKTDEAAGRESPSERFMRDFRLWGRQRSCSTQDHPSATAGSRDLFSSMRGAAAAGNAQQNSIPGAPNQSGRGSYPPRTPGRFSQGMTGAEQDRRRRAPDQPSEVSSSRPAVGKSVKNTEAAAAGMGPEKASSKYRTEGREVYIRSGVWQAWGSVAGDHEAGTMKHETVRADEAGAGSQCEDQLEGTVPLESPISWGLYARSYASVQGKLSPALRGQPGKAASQKKVVTADAAAGTAQSRAGTAGDHERDVQLVVRLAMRIRKYAWLAM